MTGLSYPADPAEAGLRLFLGWFGPYYARSVAVGSASSDGSTLSAEVSVGRRWTLTVTVLNTLAADASLEWEAARAAIEQRLDAEGRAVALWAPRGATLPATEPGLSELVLSLSGARTLGDGRLESGTRVLDDAAGRIVKPTMRDWPDECCPVQHPHLAPPHADGDQAGFTAMMASTSTAEFEGSAATPTADRVWRPLSLPAGPTPRSPPADGP